MAWGSLNNPNFTSPKSPSLGTMVKQAKSSPIEALGFTTLNSTTHLYKPSAETPNSKDPGLVIICSWAFAQDKHIAKYLKAYQEEVYPTARLLLLQGSIHNMIWRPDAWQPAHFGPAIYAIKDYLSSVGSESPKILLHVFSNGGAHSAVQLAEFYAKDNLTTLRSPMLPINALIMDSTPGYPNGALAVKALVQGLPKLPLMNILGPAFVHATVATSGIFHMLGISELAVNKVWRTTKDIDGPFLSDKIPRTYIFSNADDVIGEEDVKKHARESIKALEDAGFSDAAKNVQCEEFVGTSHVNHMLKNSDRYWKLVKDTWEKAGVA